MERYRMQWRGKLDFLFSSFGYTIGLGNLWRFPYLCYLNGGGAFLIPYVISVFFCSYPILLVEFYMGQFSSESPISVWKFCPVFKGVGWAIIFNIFITNIYYIVILMYSFYYMLVSFVNIGGPLPWEKCEPSWATKACRDTPFPDFSAIFSDSLKIKELNKLMNITCVDQLKSQMDYEVTKFEEYREIFQDCENNYTLPEEEYWNRFVLGVQDSEGLNDLGHVSGRNAMALLIVWSIVFYCCVRGIKTLAKVIYVTATFPFLMLLILFVRSVTLDGHSTGVDFYTRLDFSSMSDMGIWSSAATQAMYSVGIAFGSHIALASHNKFKNNFFRDATIIAIVDTVTSIFGGFVVFSFLGHASVTLKRPIDEIFNDQGPGTVFITYLLGISKLPSSAIWAFLFFVCVFSLGLDSAFVMVWTVYVAVEDVTPSIFEKRGKIIMAGMCVLMFLLGLPLVTSGGIHMLMVLNRYTADFTITLFIILESVAVCWVYGTSNFLNDVELMIGKRSRLFQLYLIGTIGVTAPTFGIFIFIASAVSYSTVSYYNIPTPASGEAIGWLIIATPIIILIAVAVYEIRKYGSLRAAFQESSTWGPREKCYQTGRYKLDAYIHPVTLERPLYSLSSSSDESESTDLGPASPCCRGSLNTALHV